MCITWDLRVLFQQDQDVLGVVKNQYAYWDEKQVHDYLAGHQVFMRFTQVTQPTCLMYKRVQCSIHRHNDGDPEHIREIVAQADRSKQLFVIKLPNTHKINSLLRHYYNETKDGRGGKTD